MKIQTMERSSYLSNTLGEAVQCIYDAKQGCEVDPSRVGGDTDKVAAGMKRLITTTNEVWHAIKSSAAEFPNELRVVFAMLKREVAAHFTESGTAANTAVSGFVFLRLICAAILGPQLFGLQPNYPEGQTARTLTLVSMCLMKLANGIPFGMKEPYLVPMNHFIESNRASMGRFLFEISTPKPTAGSGSDAGAPLSAPAGEGGTRLLDLGKVDRVPAFAALHRCAARYGARVWTEFPPRGCFRVSQCVAWVESNMRVINSVPLGCRLPYPYHHKSCHNTEGTSRK
jgi:hypothetical protein